MDVFQKLSFKILDFQARLIFFFVYVLLLPLFVVFYKLNQPKIPKHWTKWDIKSETLNDARKQF